MKLRFHRDRFQCQILANSSREQMRERGRGGREGEDKGTQKERGRKVDRQGEKECRHTEGERKMATERSGERNG